jgi:hypothetical protein|tara:strand:+ start:262 stop:453 length:192 start_codon:yes stop_codon:yes gene_type:complete
MNDDEMLWPPIDEMLIRRLKEIYPDKCPSIETPDREIWRYLGQVELVRMLESVYTEQNKLNED